MRASLFGDIDIRLKLRMGRFQWLWSIRAGEYETVYRLGPGQWLRLHNWKILTSRRAGFVVAPGIEVSCFFYRDALRPINRRAVTIDVETLGGK